MNKIEVGSIFVHKSIKTQRGLITEIDKYWCRCKWITTNKKTYDTNQSLDYMQYEYNIYKPTKLVKLLFGV